MQAKMERSMRQRQSTKFKSVRAVDRAIEILDCFSADRPSMSVIEIQKRVGLSRPTLYRLLETLASRGFIRAHGTPQRFSLDYGVGRLAQNWLSGLDPIAAAKPILERLHEETSETVALMITREHEAVCVLELPSSHPLSMVRGIGPTGPLARGATGKAILAFMDEKDLRSAIANLPKDINRATLLDDLAKVRRDGFRVSRGEIYAGAVAVAAPFFDHMHHVAGSIGVFGPEARLSDDRVAQIAKRVQSSAAALSSLLGDVASPKRKFASSGMTRQ
jgi:IclR family transcriptional regulator, acetate operon repressor